MEYEQFIEASCTNNIKTGENAFCSCYTFESLWVIICLRQSKKTCGILWSVWVFFELPEKRRPDEYCLWEVNLFFYI